MTALLAVSVIVAGAVGAVVRYAMSRAFPVRPRRLPGGILLVNVVGSAIAGAVVGLAERTALGEEVRLVLITGFCGGLTTFSTWSVETVELADARRWRAAILNVTLTLVLGIGAAASAYLLAR